MFPSSPAVEHPIIPGAQIEIFLFVDMKMADREDGYHLKKTCINNDVTSNLKQIRKRDAAIKQSKGFISSRSVHPSSFTAWIECFKSTDENDGSSCGPAQVPV